MRLRLNVAEFCSLLQAKPVAGLNNALAHRKVDLCLDSRQLQKGVIFWPLKGQKFDAHEFVKQAMEKGALMSVIDKNRVSEFETVLHVPVDDTNTALLRLAKGYQRRFAVRKVAITGSNGKTTTKDMLRAVLSTRWQTMCTEGNLNNQVGVPMTLFRLQHSHQMAIIEMGTNGPGEIYPLSMATEPHIAVITNIGYSHLEGLGSIENVFTEKMGIAAGLRPGGSLCINADDPLLCKLRTTTRYRLHTFGVRRGEIVPQDLEWDADGCAHFRIGRTKFDLAVPGMHNLYNALAAICVGSISKVPKANMARALASFKASKMRMEIRKANGFQIVADCYNANPSSTRMALETVGTFRSKGNRIAVLGDMLELGEQSESLHFEIGRKVPEMDFSMLCTFGTHAKHILEGAWAGGMNAAKAKHFETHSSILEYLAESIAQGDVVLVKGSRGMKLEAVVEGLLKLEPRKVGEVRG